MNHYLDDDDDLPVRDNNFSGIASKRPRNEESAQKTFMKRDMISKLDRSELEDQFLRMYDENLLLKKHCRKQEEKIKKMATKQLRLVNDKKKLLHDPSAGRNIHDVQLDDDMETLKQRLRELEKQNAGLKLKVVALRQQSLSNQAGRATVYGHVQARIDTGIAHAPPTEARILKSMRLMGQPTLHHRPGRSFSLQNGANFAQLEDENHHLDAMNTELKNQIHEYERLIDKLKEELRIKEREFEGELTKTKLKFGDEQRATVQENVDRIRLEREIKEKSSSLTQLHSQYSNLEEKLHLMKTSHDRVIREMESLNEQLKEEQCKVLALQSELKTNMTVKRQVNESEQRISDLQRECQILKEANEKLVSSAFDLEKEREWRQRENFLKVQIAQLEATLRADVGEKGGILDKLSEERVQIAQLEATLRADVGEKGGILDKLSEERGRHEELETEHQQMRIKFFEMKQKHDDLTDKMSFFSKDSAINMQEIEEALVIVKQRQQSRTPELEFLQKVDEEQHKDLDKVVKQLQAEHAETINELEKTRNMLIVQYKINKDYQMEVDIATKKLEENEREYKTRLDEYAQLLDIRAARIRKLEAQLKDVAYGTRQYRIKPEDKDQLSDEDDLEETLHLELGQNLFEIHISKLELSASGLKHLGDNDPRVFCTWEFYEFEIQSTPIGSGPRVEYGFTSQYIVQVDDFFLVYLQKDSCLLELHQSFGTDYVTVAAGHIRMQDLLEKSQGRLHGTIQLTGVREGDTGANYGTVEYWVRLRVPMEQALRLYRERTKAMGYVESNLLKAGDQTALAPLDDAARIRAPNNVNQLLIHIVGCSGVESRRKDLQPSPYCVYQFFDFTDHATQTIQSSNSPHFDDQKTFPIDMTTELDKYLVSQVLKVFVFDETDPNQSHYLGVANIPLITLSHDKEISGSFELVKNDGTCNGTLDINLRWQYTYLPPKGATRTTKLMTGTQSGAVAAAAATESVSMLPGESDALVQNKNGKKKASSKAQVGANVAASKFESPGRHPNAETPVVASVRKPLPVATVQKASAEEKALPDKVTHRDEEQQAGVNVEVVSMKSDSPKSIKDPEDRKLKAAVSPEIVSDEETLRDETQLNDADLTGGDTRPSSQLSGISATDSEGVVMPHGMTQRSAAKKPSGLDQSDMVTIVVSHVSLDENSPLLTNNNVRMLFVEYHFLGVPLEETETPYSLPKPTAPNKPISFNFTKVFHVDYDNNYERRQYLGGMLLPDDPDNGRIRFTIVSEPLDEDDEDCSDVGSAYVSIPNILKNGADIINEEVPIYDINDESNRIGVLGVSVQCLAALRVIERQLRTETMSS